MLYFLHQSRNSNSASIQWSGNTNTNWSSVYDSWHIYSFANTPNATTYGNLYNWYTATAGSGTQTGVTGGADATMSICPSAGNGKSWKLPPNTGDGSYTNLFLTKAQLVTTTSGNNATSFVNTVQAEPYGFVLSGYYDNAPRLQGRVGDFWIRSSYESDGNGSRVFDFYGASDAQNPGNFGLQSASYKYSGRAVRCGRLRKKYGITTKVHILIYNR